jgi:Serine/threonine protein kinase
MVQPRQRLPYRRLKSIGRGGYAEVFRAAARDDPANVIAFKRPHDFDEARERMVREIRVQRGLDHPNLMPILDAAEDGSWFVMPLAEGNLEDLWESGRLGIDAEPVVDAILRSIGAGLEHAHLHGAIHRDVSPRNILAFDDGDGELRWVLADWGMVKRPPGETTNRLTASGVGAGTRGFAAPETWVDGHVADERADVYSLGRVAAWLLTGTRPIPNVPLRPDGRMRGFIVECTQHDPDRRIQSMTALLERLETLLAPASESIEDHVRELVERAINEDVPVEGEVMQIAADHEDDADLYLDEVARLPVDQVERFTHDDPTAAAAIATTMLEHLGGDWGHRDFNYANVPLGWIHEVVKTLLQDGEHGLAEDLAVSFFQVEKEWNRFKQQNVTYRWLLNLPEPEGQVIARALRRAGTHAYHASLADERLASRTLAAEFRR